jgi:hypothetical protein
VAERFWLVDAVGCPFGHKVDHLSLISWSTYDFGKLSSEGVSRPYAKGMEEKLYYRPTPLLNDKSVWDS